MPIIKIINAGNQKTINKKWNNFKQMHKTINKAKFIIDEIIMIIPETFLLNKHMIEPIKEITYAPMLIYGINIMKGFGFIARTKKMSTTSKA